MRLAVLDDVPKRLRPETPRRRVHDSAKRELVTRIQGDAHVRDAVFDFLPIEKLGSTKDAVRNSRDAELLFEQLGLGIGTVEHRNPAWIGAFSLELSDLGGHELRLFLRLGKHADANRRPRFPHWFQDLRVGPLARLLDRRVGDIQDRGPRSIVLLELGDDGARKVLLEIENVVDAGAAPAVDRLIVVSDDAYVSPLVGKQANQVELRSVGILELVDEDVRESSTPLAPNPGSSYGAARPA